MRYFLIYFSLILIPTHAFAQGRPAEQIIADVRSVLRGELTSLAEVLPGYTRPSKEVPTLVVATPGTTTDDRLPWARGMGGLLRDRILSVPGIYLQMPALGYANGDGQATDIPFEEVMVTPKSVEHVARNWGATRILYSTFSKVNHRCEFNFEMKSFPEGARIGTFGFNDSCEELPTMLGQAALKTYELMGVKLDKRSTRYLQRRVPEKFAHIQAYIEAYDIFHAVPQRSQAERFGAFDKLWKQNINLPSIVPPLIALYWDVKDNAEHSRLLDDALRRYHGHAQTGLWVIYNRRIPDNDPEYHKAFQHMRKHILDYPHDPNGLLLMGYVYNAARRNKNSIPVTLEALERWPQNYRFWWNLADSLKTLAWHYRGGGYWDKVSEKGQRLFPPMIRLADEAINRALSINSERADLWVLKMQTEPGYSPSFMRSFNRAITLAPKHRFAYRVAANYARPQWGGSRAALEEIFQLAEKNIEQKEWTDWLRKTFTPK